jgi:hypothetical protein
MRAIIKRFLYALLAFALCIVTVMCGWGNLSAYAVTDESVQATYESTNVLNNLKGATIGGKEFDLADYPHNSNGKPQIISFVEFCYSYYAEKQADYGLYVYVYNPQDIAFDMSTERNKIQLTYGQKAGYSKYVLEFINYSTEAGYEGRFWKFKVKLNETQQTAILRELDEANRIYKISGIELSYKNQVTEYPCGQTYTYKGYALGYGSELAQSDTLSCKVDGFEKYLSLDVRSTYYRPKGSNGSENKQDTLHSVYFSVPNSIIDEYGEMTAVHATWLNAYTAPIFVSGNKDYYNEFMKVVGNGVTGDYAFHTNGQGRYWGGFYFVKYSHGYNYSGTENDLTKLKYAFYAENGDADTYTLPAELLIGDRKSNNKGWFETYTAKFGGSKVNNRYSAELFDKVDSEFTDVTITDKDTFKLTSVISSQNLWQKMWGTSTSYTNTYNISAIQKVTQDDIDKTLSVPEFCDEFFIAETDYNDFRDYVKAAKNKNETVYLFRYNQSEYFAVELVEGKYKTGLHMETIGDLTRPVYGTYFTDTDTNAYLCQMWVQLDFDIIDLTFTKDGVETVIPVIMSPMDIAADGTPPLVTEKDRPNILAIIFGIIFFLIVIWLLLKFCPVVFVVIGKVIVFPFKCVGALFKSIDKGIKKRKERRREKQDKEVQSEKKRRRRAEERKQKESGELPDYVWTDDKKVKPKRKRKQPKPPELNGNVSPEEVDSYLDSFDWDSVDWSKLDGKSG